MKIRDEELRKIAARRKIWSIIGWYWPAKRNGGGKYKTEWTDNPNDSKGIGFFRNNHSLNCGCSLCRGETFRKRMERRRKRHELKNEAKDLMKIFNNCGEIE